MRIILITGGGEHSLTLTRALRLSAKPCQVQKLGCAAARLIKCKNLAHLKKLHAARGAYYKVQKPCVSSENFQMCHRYTQMHPN